MRFLKTCIYHINEGTLSSQEPFPAEKCRYHAIHSEVYKWFNIKFDKFGRTSSPEQTEVCHAIFHKLMENNWLTENTMQQVQLILDVVLVYSSLDVVYITKFIYLQLYCDTCQRFLADRLVEGTCPNKVCNAAARGDQCETCSTLLNPTELIDPKCKVSLYITCCALPLIDLSIIIVNHDLPSCLLTLYLGL